MRFYLYIEHFCIKSTKVINTLNGSYYLGRSLINFSDVVEGKDSFINLYKYFLGNLLKPIIAPIIPPTIQAFVSLSPAYFITDCISYKNFKSLYCD